jgi:1,4-alpha-glucan branching enzyme
MATKAKLRVLPTPQSKSKPKVVKSKPKLVKSKREEAAPTFPTWRQRLEEKEQALQQEVEQFLEVVKVLGTPMMDDSSIHFLYYNPGARQVAVTGEFNQWDLHGVALTPLGQTGIFYHTLELHEPVRVEYKLIVDGQWIVDPLCPNTVDNGIGEQNSFFAVTPQRPPHVLLGKRK